ncbi:MAG: LysR family transcriptional regulator [Oceanospirillaceae bacterium]|nr:LysR family transcriptional regulator [Oceanospirillaceae bacterium]
MNLSYLESYAAVISEGSFSAAAEHLQVSKGLISRHVQKLEKELGVLLLHRTTRVIRMSEAGQKLYRESQKIFSLAHQVQRDIVDMAQEVSGLLRFTAPISIGDRIIVDLLPKYRALCPEVMLELNFSNREYDLASGENDIALRAFASLPELVVAKPLGRVRNVLVASEQYLARYPLLTAMHQLHKHNCILNSHQQEWNLWQYAAQSTVVISAEPTEIAVSGNIATSKYASAKILALQGEGIANLPWYSVDKLVKSGELTVVLPEYHFYFHQMAVIHAAQRVLPKKLRIFKALLVEWFVEHPEYLE